MITIIVLLSGSVQVSFRVHLFPSLSEKSSDVLTEAVTIVLIETIIIYAYKLHLLTY